MIRQWWGHPSFTASHLPLVSIRPSWFDRGTLRRPPKSLIAAGRPTSFIYGRLKAHGKKPTDNDGWPRSSCPEAVLKLTLLGKVRLELAIRLR
jgi:hypothetical protein